MSVPDGWVDPTAPDQVTIVLRAVQADGGPPALIDLLRRLPGVGRTAPVARGFLRAAVPERIWLGPENAITVADALEHEHLVNGVVLHRAYLDFEHAPAVLAGLIARHVAATGSRDEASAVLTAARDLQG